MIIRTLVQLNFFFRGRKEINREGKMNLKQTQCLASHMSCLSNRTLSRDEDAREREKTSYDADDTTAMTGKRTCAPTRMRFFALSSTATSADDAGSTSSLKRKEFESECSHSEIMKFSDVGVKV